MKSVALVLSLLALGAICSASPAEDLSFDSLSELRPGEEATLLLPARVRIPARWRLLNAHKAFSVVHVNMSAGPSVKAEYCLHQNESLQSGSCESSGARSGFLMKGLPRLDTVSPFEEHILDLNTSTKQLMGKHVTVSVTEAFQLHRLIFFLLGHVLLLLAPIVSTSLVFYYSSGMLFGVILVAVFLVFQMSRLLPVNRKKAWNALILGSMLGLSTMVWDSLQSLLVGVLQNLGLDQGAETLVFPFAVLILLLVGAFLGFWLVRRFVLDPSGHPDRDTATFVDWAIKLTAFLTLFLSSRDWVFIITNTLSGVITVLAERHVRARLGKRPEESDSYDASDLDVLEEEPSTPSPSFGSWNPRRARKRSSNSSELNVESTAFPSSFQTPDKKKLHTPAEIEDISRELTERSVGELMKSPEFTAWLASKALDRIQVSPLSSRKGRSPQEIEKTGTEGDSVVAKLNFFW